MVRIKQTPNRSKETFTKSKKEEEEDPIRKPHRYHPGTVALREIRKQQGEKGTRHLALRRGPFKAVVRDVVEGLMKTDPHLTDTLTGLRFQRQSMTALQVASEHMLVGLLREANTCAVASGKMTITSEHLRFAYNRSMNPHIWQQPDATSRMLKRSSVSQVSPSITSPIESEEQ